MPAAAAGQKAAVATARQGPRARPIFSENVRNADQLTGSALFRSVFADDAGLKRRLAQTR